MSIFVSVVLYVAGAVGFAFATRRGVSLIVCGLFVLYAVACVELTHHLS